MNELIIKIDDKVMTLKAPSCFDEMNRNQFIETGKFLLGFTDGDGYFLSMIGLKKKIWDALEDYHRYAIRQLFDFIDTSSAEISRQLLPFIEIEDERFIGYQPNFSNTSWEEFIFADQYIMNGKHREAAAVLYRPQRTDYSGETDRRVPFSIYGTNSRMNHFNEMDEAQLLSFVINYRALRKNNIEDKYPFIFSSRKTQTDSQTPSSFSWIGIHRDLMGDQFYDETKFFSTNVHVILNRLNIVIKENLHRKK